MHPATSASDLSRARAIRRHPSAGAVDPPAGAELVTLAPRAGAVARHPQNGAPGVGAAPLRPDRSVSPRGPRWADEEGSLVTEYGLVALLGATIAGLAIKWASGGAIWELFSSVLQKALSLVGV